MNSYYKIYDTRDTQPIVFESLIVKIANKSGDEKVD